MTPPFNIVHSSRDDDNNLTVTSRSTWDVVVVGGGPAGLVMVATLLQDHPDLYILWFDQDNFNGGRLSKFLNVPSNTRVNLFLKYGEFVKTRLSPPSTNLSIMEELKRLPAEQGCSLELAWRLVRALSNQLFTDNLLKKTAMVTDLKWIDASHNWQVEWQIEKTIGTIKSHNVILATGSHPRPAPLITWSPSPSTHPIALDPEIFLAPSPSSLPTLNTFTPSTTIAVIGGSHSAILIIRTLLQNSSVGRIINLYRTPLRYAEYQPDGTIVYDNVGLKGQVAIWARKHLENNLDCNTFYEGRLQRICTTVDETLIENQLYAQWLPQCQATIWAIGYEPYSVGGQQYHADSKQRLLSSSPSSSYQPGLFGLGIAFPQLVKDHPEWPPITPAVGLYKFMRSAACISLQILTKK